MTKDYLKYKWLVWSRIFIAVDETMAYAILLTLFLTKSYWTLAFIAGPIAVLMIGLSYKKHWEWEKNWMETDHPEEDEVDYGYRDPVIKRGGNLVRIIMGDKGKDKEDDNSDTGEE